MTAHLKSVCLCCVGLLLDLYFWSHLTLHIAVGTFSKVALPTPLSSSGNLTFMGYGANQIDAHFHAWANMSFEINPIPKEPNKGKYSGNAKLSILLPCFNKRHYLDRSLTSIFNLGLPADDFVVLIVDDCSSDNTEGKVREYQEKYSNIFYYKNDINLGILTTRVLLVNYTTTPFLAFLDPDDSFGGGDGVVAALNIISQGEYDMVE